MIIDMKARQQRQDSKAQISHYGKVAVLMGGTSAEREISLETGHAVYKALQRKGVDAQTVDAKGNFLEALINQGFDRVFIALHGRGGEDGVVQGALEVIGLPYTGSGVLGSALALDKPRAKWLWESHEIATPEFVEIMHAKDLEQACEEIGFPLMLKPVHEGSSYGVTKAANNTDIERAFDTARKFDQRVMAERWIEGDEYTVSILDNEILPMIRLETPHEFYDYRAKYVEETTRYICPCGLDDDMEKAVGETALRAFELIGASGWGRVDLIIDKAGIAWMIEVNTVPGMTSHSLVPMAARQAGIEFDDLVLGILDTSMENKEQRCEGAA